MYSEKRRKRKGVLPLSRKRGGSLKGKRGRSSSASLIRQLTPREKKRREGEGLDRCNRST